MSKTGREKRRKTEKRKLRKTIVPLPISATRTANEKEQTGTSRPQPKKEKRPEKRFGRGNLYPMFGLFSIICISLLFVVALFFFGHYWQAGNSVPALWWGIAALIFAILGVGSYVQGYVISKEAVKSQPLSERDVKDRPIVFIKTLVLDEPLAVGKTPSITFILANSGSMEAEVKLWDCTTYFEPTIRRGGPDPIYAETVENVVKVAPDPEGHTLVRIWMPNINLTANELKQIAEGRANLYFYARGNIKTNSAGLGTFHSVGFITLPSLAT